MAASGASYTNIMISTPPPTKKNPIRDNDMVVNSKLLTYNSSPLSVRHLDHHQQQQLPNQRQKQKWNNNNNNNNNNNADHNNNKTMHTPKQQRKKVHAAPQPAPFLSFQVERENCAVYVGNIPSDERSPGPICENKPVPGDTQQLSDDDPCAVELKAFLRDRINAAFKVPVEEIGIRTCRLFSVVTNVYSNNSNSDTDNNHHNTADGDNHDGSESPSSSNNTPRRQRSGRRVHRAACVEFDDPTIAEHCLALKFTSFHFNGQSHNRSSLRMRRWTSQPPPPPEKTKSLSPNLWSPKQPPPPPRSKSQSPKISNLKQKLPPPPPPRPKSASPNAVPRKQQLRRKQLSLSTTINERPNSPQMLSSTTDPFDVMEDVADERTSPSFLSSCMVYVANIPSEATSEELREFFLERMNKAFHGVTPPEILRLGMRYSGAVVSDTSSRIDACVEFQDPKVAHRATLLRNRRWYAKDDELQTDEDGVDEDDINSNSNHSDEKKKRNSMPVLEIELWDSTKYDTSDFFFMNENKSRASKNTILGSTFYQANEHEEDLVDSGLYRTSPKPSPKSSPSQLKQHVEEARKSGFLVCSNPNKIPKCDHLFTILPQPGEDTSCLEVKKARLCHGYAFLGKVCRNVHNKRNSKKLCGPLCQFAHFDSFDQLKDPHDIMSLLYYVENNDDVEFIPGTGCTPQEYLLRQRELQPSAEKENSPISPLNPQTDSLAQSTENLLRELRISLSAVRQELSATQQQLRNSELARHALLEQQALTATGNSAEDKGEKDATILTLQDEVARLRNDLQETNHQLKASALAAENNRRDYEFLQEKYQHHVSREGKAGISTELLESEIIKLREELKKSQADCQALQQQQQQPSGSPASDFEDSWPETNLLDSFLERSTPSLMQMMDKHIDDQRQLDLTPKPRLADIPIDIGSSPRAPYKAVIDCNPIQSLGLASPLSPTTTTTSPQISPSTTNADALRSEIAYLVSCYGNQVFVNSNATDGSTTVTRFLKLPMNLYQGRDIDVALVLTLPKDYPWNGIVDIHSDPRLSNHFGADSQYRKLVSESISGLLNVCRWEAEACQGKPHVLMSIMKAAERWVMNDWKIIQKKKWVMEYDSEESHLSSA